MSDRNGKWAFLINRWWLWDKSTSVVTEGGLVKLESEQFSPSVGGFCSGGWDKSTSIVTESSWVIELESQQLSSSTGGCKISPQLESEQFSSFVGGSCSGSCEISQHQMSLREAKLSIWKEQFSSSAGGCEISQHQLSLREAEWSNWKEQFCWWFLLWVLTRSYPLPC